MGEVLTLPEARGGRFYTAPQMPVEANLLAFPLFLVSSTKGGRKGWFSYRRTIVHTPEDGEPRRVEQEWIVQGGHRYGLARAVDLDLCMTLLEVAQRGGGMPDDGRVYFSLYELKELLGWSRSGEIYDLIRQSIDRTAAVSITSNGAFWSPSRGEFISKTFHLWTSSIRSSWDHEGRTSERKHVKFDELLVEGLQHGYINQLDPAFFRSLRQSTAKRLYMLADHHCDSAEGKPAVWEIAPFDLMEQMPLARYDRAKKVEEVLDKGHEELVHAGYFEDVQIERGKRNTPLLFRYVQSPAFARKRLGAEIERDPAGAIALAKLAAERINRAVAVELVSEFGAAFCTRQAELLPFIPGVDPKKAPGLLVKAIRNRWPWEQRVANLPKGRAVASVPGVPTAPVGEEDAGFGWFARGRDPAPAGGAEEAQETPPEETQDEPDPPDTAAEEAWAALVEDLGAEVGPENVGYWSDSVRAAWLRSGRLGLEAEHGAAGTEMLQTAADELLRLWRGRQGDGAAIEVWSAARPESRVVMDRDGARKIAGDVGPEAG